MSLLWPCGLKPCQATLSAGFSRQKYRSGLPFSSPGYLSDPGIEPTSPALAGRFFTVQPPGKSPLISFTSHFLGGNAELLNCLLDKLNLYNFLTYSHLYDFLPCKTHLPLILPIQIYIHLLKFALFHKIFPVKTLFDIRLLRTLILLNFLICRQD